jgi:hypothetical protein
MTDGRKPELKDLRIEKVLIIEAEKPLNAPLKPSVLTMWMSMASILKRLSLRPSAPTTPPFFLPDLSVGSSSDVCASTSAAGSACRRVLAVSRGYTSLLGG